MLALGASAGLDQGYPSRPIRLVPGFGAGGNADTVARILAAALSPALAQQVVVEPRTGAGGNLASEFVAKGPAEGYTLVLLTGAHAVSAGLYKTMTFHPIDDFAMISIVTHLPFVIPAQPDHSARDLPGLIKVAREQQIKHSSVAVGTPQHLA